MRPVVFRPAARRDLRQLARYLVSISGSHEVGRAFVGDLIAHCYRLARFSSQVGRLRPDLGRDMRSTPFKRYTIVFRYDGEEFLVVRIVSAYRQFGARDVQT